LSRVYLVRREQSGAASHSAWQEYAMPKSSTSKPDLRLVPGDAEIYDLMRTPETTTERVRRLQLEARALAVEQVEALERVLLDASRMAREIADGGDAYPVGARELASRLSSDLPAKAETLKAIVSRSL
jgi:hypothetical protein